MGFLPVVVILCAAAYQFFHHRSRTNRLVPEAVDWSGGVLTRKGCAMLGYSTFTQIPMLGQPMRNAPDLPTIPSGNPLAV
jgi:hypothetical protein